MAHREGLNVSEWLRNLIIGELKRNQVLPNILRAPNINLEISKNE
jgi:hypothetical protein